MYTGREHAMLLLESYDSGKIFFGYGSENLSHLTETYLP